MEQGLIELLLASKKALATGQSICAQANTIHQTSEKHVETIEKIHPKLLFIDNHIMVQLTMLERIRDFFAHNQETVIKRIKDQETTLQSLTYELTQVFNLLKSCTIDRDILQVNRERNNQQQQQSLNDPDSDAGVVTLFDYISDQEIIESQSQADDEIGEIESISNALQNQTKSLTATIQELAQMKDTAMDLSMEDSITRFSNEKIQIQEEEMSKMAEILSSLTDHYDQLGEATRLYQSDPEGGEQLDITVLKDDHEHIPNILEDLKSSLDVVEAISEETQIKMHQSLKIKDDLIQVLDRLHYFGAGGQADAICEKLIVSDMEIKEHEHKLQGFFEQLANLADWYKQYASSYNFLLLEIERRKKAQQRQLMLEQELNRQIEDAYSDELEERKSWSAQHGQYLPQVLCPFINDSPSKLKVELDSQVARLPDLSPENIEKALSDIHNSHQHLHQ